MAQRDDSTDSTIDCGGHGEEHYKASYVTFIACTSHYIAYHITIYTGADSVDRRGYYLYI